MNGTLKLIALAITLVVVVWSVYRAGRNGTSTQFVASALVLLMGIFLPVVKPPQQTIEETRDQTGRAGESGDPPT